MKREILGHPFMELTANDAKLNFLVIVFVFLFVLVLVFVFVFVFVIFFVFVFVLVFVFVFVFVFVPYAYGKFCPSRKLIAEGVIPGLTFFQL